MLFEKQFEKAMAKRLPLVYKPRDAAVRAFFIGDEHNIVPKAETIKPFNVKTLVNKYFHTYSALAVDPGNEEQLTLKLSDSFDHLMLASCTNDIENNYLPAWLKHPAKAAALLDEFPLWMLLAVKQDLSKKITITFAEPVAIGAPCLGDIDKFTRANISVKEMTKLWHLAKGKAETTGNCFEAQLHKSRSRIMELYYIYGSNNKNNAEASFSPFGQLNMVMQHFVMRHADVTVSGQGIISLKMNVPKNKAFWSNLGKLLPANLSPDWEYNDSTTDEDITSELFDYVPQLAFSDKYFGAFGSTFWPKDKDGLPLGYVTDICINTFKEIADKVGVKLLKTALKRSLYWQIPIAAKSEIIYDDGSDDNDQYNSLHHRLARASFFETDTKSSAKRNSIAKITWQEPKSALPLEIVNKKINLNASRNTYLDVDPKPEKNLPEIFNIIQTGGKRQAAFGVKGKLIAFNGRNKINKICCKKIK